MAPQLQIRQRQALMGLFTLTLIVSLLLGTASPIHPQATSPSPEEVLREEIRALAERDVQNDIPRRTQFAINFYSDNSVGLSAPEIAKIYDEEYTQQAEEKQQVEEKQAKDKQRDLREFLKPENGIFITVLALISGIIGAVLKDALTEKVTGFFQAIDDWIYARFAGSQLFRGIALRRYQEAVFEKYKALHIPFRGNRPPLDMAEVYVPLKVEGSTGREQIDAYGAITQHRRLMVKGPPGSGKTMLLKHLALSYGAGRLNLPNWPVPVLLELHRLSDPELTQEKLIQAVVDAFNRDNFPKAERFVRQSLQQGTLMLLLDGLDEVNSNVRPRVVQQIKDLLNTYEKCRAIITCRTAVYRFEFASVTEQTLEVIEFSDQQIRRFLRAWENEMPKDKSIEQLIQTLRNRPQIMALARNPLLLTIIAHFYSDPSFVLPYSRSEFYRKSTGILLEQWDQWRGDFNQYKAVNKRRVLQYLALFSQNRANRDQQDRHSISHRTVLEEIRKILPDLNLQPDENTEPILNEIVERSGLLLRIDGGERYQFAHVTLQEYFAAEALKDDVDGLAAWFKQAPDEWREVVKLWCGFEGNSTKLIQAVYETDAITGFECLADAQEVAPALANSIIDRFKAQLGVTGQPDQLASAFGAVAADFRPRGKAVFKFLTQILDNPQETTRYQAAANSLSMTNLPQAADILAEHYGYLPEIREPLVRMGDLAVTALTTLAPQHPTALGDLFTIGTPGAATALVSLLWSDTTQTRAAWYLAGLLHQSSVEEALRMYDLAAEQWNADSLDWIWQPFDESPSSALPIIAGRIAHLIANASIETALDPLPALDSRLVVPVCAIHMIDQVTLPKSWPQQAERLWEQQAHTLEIEEQRCQAIDKLLEPNGPNSRWRLLLSGITPKLQLDLLRLLIVYHQPDRNDWRNIWREVKYELRRGWHYRCVLLIAAALSIAAIFGMLHIVVHQQNNWIKGLFSLAYIVVLAFWSTLWKGVEKPLEPSTFFRFGLLGLVTFGLELCQLFHNHLVWSGIEPIFQSLKGKGMARVVALTLALTLARAVAGAGARAVAAAVAAAVAWALAVTWAWALARARARAGALGVAWALAVALAWAGALAVTWAGAWAGAGAGAWALAGAGVLAGAGAWAVAGAGAVAWALAMAGAVAVVVAGAVSGGGPWPVTVALAVAVADLAGGGLGAWYRAKESERDRIRFLAVFAFPWFCWFPIVGIFGTLGLRDFLSLTWLQTVLVDLLLVGICTLLWRRGQQLEDMARNPLQGGILEAELRARCGRQL